MKKFLPFIVLFLAASSFTLAQQSLNMSLIAQWDPDTLPTAGTREFNDIWGYVDCEGREYAILGSAAKVHFFDLNDPENPVEVNSFPGGNVTTWRDMKTYRNRAYSICDGCGEGLMIFDLSDLPNSVTKTYQSTDFFSRAHNIFVDNGRLYVVGSNTQSNGVIILDIDTDPDNPTLLASVNLSPGGYVHDIYVRNDTAFGSHAYNGFYVWDVKDPQNPQAIASVGSSGYNHSSWAMDNRPYAVFAEEVPTGLPLSVVDLSELNQNNIETKLTFKEPLEAPQHLGATPHNPFFRGDYLIVSYYEDGVQIYDFSDPLDPQRIAYYDTHPTNDDYNGYFGCWGVYPFLPSGLILASDINGGLFILSADSIQLDTILPPTVEAPEISSSTGNTICEGESTVLSTDANASQFFWFKNDTLLNGVDTNVLVVNSPGIYTLEIEAANNFCTGQSLPFQLDLQEAPEFSDWPDEYFLCPNELVLFASPIVADSYAWYLNGSLISDASEVFVGDPGNYHLTVSLSACSFSSPLTTITLFEDDPVVPLQYPNYLCEGESALIQGPEGMADYEWYKDGVVFPMNASEIEVFEAGSYYLFFTTPQGCSIQSDTAEITGILPPSTAVTEQNIPFCPGESGLLILDESNTDSIWTWMDSNGNILSDTSFLEVFSAGIYHLAVTSIFGCYSNADFSVSVFDVTPPELSVSGDTIFSSSAMSYQWFKDNEIIPGAEDAFYVPQENGEYRVEVMDFNGCISSSDPLPFVINNLINSSSGHNSVVLFPNPAQDRITVNTTNKIDQIEILDIYGRILDSKDSSNLNQSNFEINLHNLAKGMYWMKIKFEETEEIIVVSFVKQ